MRSILLCRPRNPSELQQRASLCWLRSVGRIKKEKNLSRDLRCLLWFVRLRRHERNLAGRADHFRDMQKFFHHLRKHTFNQEDVLVWSRLVHGHRNIWTPYGFSNDQPHSLSITVLLHTFRPSDYIPTSSVPSLSCSCYPFQSSESVRNRTPT